MTKPNPENLINVSDATFKQTIEQSPFVLVYCWADWCEPCKTFAPVFERVASQYSDYLFAKLNIDHTPTVRQFFNIERIPALLVIKDQVVIDSVVEAMSEQELTTQLGQWAAFDMQLINDHFDQKTA